MNKMLRKKTETCKTHVFALLLKVRELSPELYAGKRITTTELSFGYETLVENIKKDLNS